MSFCFLCYKFNYYCDLRTCSLLHGTHLTLSDKNFIMYSCSNRWTFDHFFHSFNQLVLSLLSLLINNYVSVLYQLKTWILSVILPSSGLLIYSHEYWKNIKMYRGHVIKWIDFRCLRESNRRRWTVGLYSSF